MSTAVDTQDSENEEPINSLRSDDSVLRERQQILSNLIEQNVFQVSTFIEGDEELKLIIKPSASSFKHSVMHPASYRILGGVRDWNHLAELLESDPDWETKYRILKDSPLVATAYSVFSNLEYANNERTLEGHFIHLVKLISVLLEKHCLIACDSKVIVGGFLALSELDICTKTDVYFFESSTKRKVLATKVKTTKSFPEDEPWYQKSRGVQVLCALYGHNAPTFLITQKYWKLFIENSSRTEILTFPFGTETDARINSTCCRVMSHEIIKAIVICLLSNRKKTVKSIESVKVASSSQLSQTPEKPSSTPKTRVSPFELRRSNRGQKEESTSSFENLESNTTVQPSFISGYSKEGSPIRTFIRVFSDQTVQKIEEIIQEKQLKL